MGLKRSLPEKWESRKISTRRNLRNLIQRILNYLERISSSEIGSAYSLNLPANELNNFDSSLLKSIFS